MKVWVIATRAFRMGEYFPRLEETAVKTTLEDAKKEFIKQREDLCDWMWDGGPYQRITVDDFTFIAFLDDDDCIGVVTMREVEE